MRILARDVDLFDQDCRINRTPPFSCLAGGFAGYQRLWQDHSEYGAVLPLGKLNDLMLSLHTSS